MINVIYDCGFEAQDDLKEDENRSTHYSFDNETHEFTVDQLNKDFDITVYDCLSILGMRNFLDIKNIKSKYTEKKEKIKWICIHHFFANYTIPYTYTFYRILLEDKISDPSDFLE